MIGLLTVAVKHYEKLFPVPLAAHAPHPTAPLDASPQRPARVPLRQRGRRRLRHQLVPQAVQGRRQDQVQA